jgi:dTMP kinase
MFIDFEGIDGCGKGTQVERAVGYLRQAFSKATSLKYPDRTTPIGKLIDAYLKGKVTLDWWSREDRLERGDAQLATDNALAMQGLQWANRLECQYKLQKLLSRGHVVADRYCASGIAYGTADGLDLGYLLEANSTLEQSDLTILLDIPVEESWKRRPERQEMYEADPERLRKARTVYLQLAKANPHKWLVLDGQEDKDVLEVQVREAIDNLYQRDL